MEDDFIIPGFFMVDQVRIYLDFNQILIVITPTASLSLATPLAASA